MVNGENQEQNNQIENNSKFTLKHMEKENLYYKENRGQMRQTGGGRVNGGFVGNNLANVRARVRV